MEGYTYFVPHCRIIVLKSTLNWRLCVDHSIFFAIICYITSINRVNCVER